MSIYSATYSNVPVYEFNVGGNHVMRRRADDWINATHILKVADYDKPARTRILEREVQKGVHEKVQGGYGKYQGTWIPLEDGRDLADRLGVLSKLLPIFDFVPGPDSPPPAPKHATAVSSRPRAPRQSAAAAARIPAPVQYEDEKFENGSTQFSEHIEEATPDNITIVSDSVVEDPDMLNATQYSHASRKRKRGQAAVDIMSQQDHEYQMWADSLLDYFMLLESDDRFPSAPEPPPNTNLDKPIDDKGHTAMHWAAAMGDVGVVRDLINRGARIDCPSNNLETPLMRAVMFTNNFDKQTMTKMITILQPTVVKTDWFGSTVFHHIAATTSSKNKFLCARYYFDCIIAKLAETWIPDEITRLLNAQDKNGDTAIMIAARNGARKCVRALLGRSVALDVPNIRGETADDLIRELNARRREGHAVRARQASSSPFAPIEPPLHNRVAGFGINGDLNHHPTLSGGESGVVGPSAFFDGLQAAASGTSQQPPSYRSATAATLMSKLAPTLLEKCQALAGAYEAELEEKDVEAAEAARVARKRQAELDAVRRQIAELAALDGSRDSGLSEGGIMGGGDTMESVVDGMGGDLAVQAQGGRDDGLDSELAAAEAEAAALIEFEQSIELAKLIAKEEASPSPSAAGADKASSPTGSSQQDSNDPATLLPLVAALFRAQQERRDLVREVVRNLSAAGMGQRQAEYKRLITGALGVREADVEGMLPEILMELEEAREREGVEGGLA
ncbi:hypothetical protein BDY21DRAFT_368316 [Lineolata rhizophorae]|uniref:HTH APSES-type domain-containing protein n=1 Tax=Lineolata rhizophorae TaxID=578093 RepID=A0A6A6PE00_9PEZI|nr:hypothetical protein BDY21DRAFT_368316 [Lineolata rhizophorae]